MKLKSILFGLLLISFTARVPAQDSSSLTINLSISEKMQPHLNPDGRLFIFITQNPNVEPRTRTWPSPGNSLFGRNITGFNPDKILELTGSDDWMKTPEWNLDAIPHGVYYLQVVWDQDTKESRPDAPGNLYSNKHKVELNQPQKLDISIDNIIGPREVVDHELVRIVDIKSDTLSAWWDKPVYVKASVLLPHAYEENPEKAYPIRYNVSGYGGRYTRVNRIVHNEEFMDWWQSDDAPQVINVFLDGEGPFGDSYQIDSDNSGPYGYSLINEVIPHIESKYRNTNSPETRFVDGCSTGGWVSLALQLFYPETFNGTFSYSPDAVDFEHLQLINVYKDKNAYVNEFGYLRPVMRDIYGEPMLSLKEFIQYENVLGSSNTYLNSGMQFSAHNALYGPKGEDGLPAPLFHPLTGEMDSAVAEHYKEYDLKLYAEQNWEELGPKIQGKIYIWMGDMDHFYLNPATRSFDQFLDNTTNPKSDAEVEFSAMEGHCSKFSYKEVLQKIHERLGAD